MKRLLMLLAFILAAAAVYLWFLNNFEKQTEREYVGYTGEARFNDFLAAELLLLELDIDAESRQKLRPSTWLPPETDTLVTRLGPEIATVSESTTLMNWVRLGGHLVLLPPLNETRDMVAFLADLNVRYVWPEAPLDEDDQDDTQRAAEEFEYLLDLDYIYQRIEPIEEAPAGATLSDDEGIIATRSQVGNGFITVYSSDTLFVNGSITDIDHARLFLDSVAGFVDPGKVWLFYDTEFTPLWRLIWDAARYLVIGLALAFVAWLWSRMPRFGPVLAVPSGERRSIVEHVSATGRFVWQHNASSALVRASVAAVIGRAERRHPGIGRLPPEKQAIAIGRLTGDDPQKILHALMVSADDRPREFAQHMQLLQKIRNGL